VDLCRPKGLLAFFYPRSLWGAVCITQISPATNVICYSLLFTGHHRLTPSLLHQKIPETMWVRIATLARGIGIADAVEQ
jgi:hypothetical protein